MRPGLLRHTSEQRTRPRCAAARNGVSAFQNWLYFFDFSRSGHADALSDVRAVHFEALLVGDCLMEVSL
jgi:hypothetical protein